MLVCLSCNIEYNEEKKFCSYCGGHLVTKEDFASNGEDLEKKEEKPDQRLICPNCKTIYEFGTTCIRCGSDLIAEIPSEPKEVSEDDRKRPPLFLQALTQTLKEEKATVELKIREGTIHLQTIQEPLIKIPRKNLICPHCRIIYERGNSCVRCGSSLVMEIGQDKGMPESPGTPFDPSTPDKTLKDPVEGSEPKIPSASSSKRRNSGPARDGLQRQAERIEREQPELFSDSETDKTFETTKQDSATGSADTPERRSFHPRKRKINYRRFFVEASSISIMILAGGYLVWSIYSRVMGLPGPMSSHPEEVSAPARSPHHATAQVPVSQESRNVQSDQRSAISKEKSEAPSPSSSIPSNALVVGALEKGKIIDLLEHIRQANLQKNIDLFLSCYAADFKDREGKKKTTLSFWKKFDYLELSYDLKATSIAGSMARIKIEWVIKISSKAGGNAQESKTFYNAILKKEEGSWKIQEVQEVG